MWRYEQIVLLKFCHEIQKYLLLYHQNTEQILFWIVSELIPTSPRWVCRALTDSCNGLICAWWGVNSDVSASSLLTPSLLLLSRLLFFMLSMFFRTDLVVLQREKCRRQGSSLTKTRSGFVFQLLSRPLLELYAHVYRPLQLKVQHLTHVS